MTILRHLVYYVAQKAAADPDTWEKMARTVRSVIQKTDDVVHQEDRAYAAGRAVRLALDKLRGK